MSESAFPFYKFPQSKSDGSGDTSEASKRREYHSYRFYFRGYDGSLWIEIANKDDSYNRKGDVMAGFNKEYRDYGNGYYYSLIDDEHFIGTDID